jgi:CRP/FNR family transcriptional regulator, cyclic AMP receptor protein
VAEQYFHEVQAAVAASFLAAFPEAALTSLLAESRLITIPAGTTNVGRADLPQAGLVVRGLLRLFLASPEGRQVTVRYVRGGETVGVVASVGGAALAGGQALSDTLFLSLDPRTLQTLAREHGAVAWAMAEELTRVLNSVLDELAGNTFGSARQKVARHILSTSSIEPGTSELIAAISQQDLADAIGSVREVVGRTAAELSRDGLIRSTRHGIVIVDAVGLHEAAWVSAGNKSH